MAWIVSPEPACSWAKHNFPVLRKNITRPAMPTKSPVVASGAKSGYFKRTALIVVVIGTRTG